MVVWNKPAPALETGKYRAAEFIPFSMPASLDGLEGGESMTFSLPVTVYWGPKREPFDMSVPGDVIRAYSEIISHAGEETQRRLLNRNLLRRHWRELHLDRRRVRPAWETRFPELKEA